MPPLRPRSLSAHQPHPSAFHLQSSARRRHLNVAQLAPSLDRTGEAEAAEEEAVEFEDEDGEEEDGEAMDLDEADEEAEEAREKEERLKTFARLEGSPSPSPSPRKPPLRTYWSEGDFARREGGGGNAVKKREQPLTLAQRRGVGIVSIVRAERRKLELELGRAKLVLRSPSSPRTPPSLRPNTPTVLRKARSSSLKPVQSPLSPLSPLAGGGERRWDRASEGMELGGSSWRG